MNYTEKTLARVIKICDYSCTYKSDSHRRLEWPHPEDVYNHLKASTTMNVLHAVIFLATAVAAVTASTLPELERRCLPSDSYCGPFEGPECCSLICRDYGDYYVWNHV